MDAARFDGPGNVWAWTIRSADVPQPIVLGFIPGG
ncbi:MAG: hypothetical protein K0S98_1262 [Propionibacteriaceae bacterium]|jgi:hypothetical protein|nr:hypothetical protein [Propionibacteriaceae bacterium]